VKSDGAGMSCFVSPLHRGKSQISRGRRTGAVRRLKGSWGELLLTSLVGGLEHGFYDFPYIGNVIIPTDELIFFRGVGIPATTSSPFLPCWTVCPPCPCPFFAEVLPWIDVAVQISQLVQTGSPICSNPAPHIVSCWLKFLDSLLDPFHPGFNGEIPMYPMFYIVLRPKAIP